MTASGNAFDGYAVGGTVQFAWDQSFYATAMTLLDPAAARADAAAWEGRDFAHFFGIELDDMNMTGYFYAYNAVSVFRALAGCVRDAHVHFLFVGAHSA